MQRSIEMDDSGSARAELPSRMYCNFQEGIGGYVPPTSLPILRNMKNLSGSDRLALEELKKEFEILTGVESVTILENQLGFSKDDEVFCRHVILVKLAATPLRDRVNNMNDSFYYKLKRLKLQNVELQIKWEDFIFDPPV